jgi:hypothetical protein
LPAGPARDASVGTAAPRLRKRPTDLDTDANAVLSIQRRQENGGLARVTSNMIPTSNQVPRIPPKPDAPPSTSAVPKSDEEIERVAKRLKAAYEAAPTVKLAPLPAARMATARRNMTTAAAARMPDLAPVSSEKKFLWGLLATDLQKLKW